ncbi:MAG: TonB-dependent receptor, partial [Chloroflexia bacterium]|nr:TonB-dependent receptor [Chloroflexia bacterium]
LSGEYGFFGFNLDMPTHSKETQIPSIEDIYKIEETDLEIAGYFVNTSLTLEQKFDEKGNHKLETSLIYSNWDGEINSGLNDLPTDALWQKTGNNYRNRTIQNDYQDDYRLKVDYTLPLSEKSTLETGLQTRFLLADSKFRGEDFSDLNQDWVVDNALNNGFDFHRNIYSAYASISGTVLGMSAKIGLRGEYTDRLLQTIDNDKYALDRVDIIPSVHLSKKLSGEREIQASYTRKINRPEEWNLNPNPIITTEYVKQSGNPDLLPELTDSYELNFMQRMKKGFVSVEGYYRQTNDAIDRTINYNESEDITEIGIANLNRNFAYGAEIASNLNLAKWFSVYASVNIYGTKIKGELVSEGVETESVGSDFVLNSNFTFLKATRLQVTSFYNSPRLTAQGQRSEMYGVNLALNRSFFNRKFDVSVRARDVLNTMKFKFKANSPGSKTDFTFDMDSPSFMVSVGYRINNYKKRKETEGLEIGGGGVM